MCGIYGMVGADAEAVLPRMSAALVHRGPDGDGRAVRGAGGLGCRRLAIIDVAGGAQPLRNEAGDVIAVCNGEIYNSASLRSALQARGHRFRTRSDAEVLPHLCEKPLYYAATPDGFFFASEPKALLAGGAVADTPDWTALALYLRTGYVPAPASAFREIV